MEVPLFTRIFANCKGLDKSQNITKTVFPNDVSDSWKKGEQKLTLLRSILREQWQARVIARLKWQALAGAPSALTLHMHLVSVMLKFLF